MRQSPEQRPTARELAAQSNGTDPWACPRCGCTGPHRVENTYDTADGRKRRRICRSCGQGLIATIEKPVREGFKIVEVPDDSAVQPLPFEAYGRAVA